MTSCAGTKIGTPSPTSGPTPTPTATSPVLTPARAAEHPIGEIRGEITGVDPNDVPRSVTIRIVRCPDRSCDFDYDAKPGAAEFAVAPGPWKVEGIYVPGGSYIIVPLAPGYLSTTRAHTIPVPEEGTLWRFSKVDFSFLRPERAEELLGMPLCPPAGQATAPAGTTGVIPTPAYPEPGKTWTGVCFNPYGVGVTWAEVKEIGGKISGLAQGESLTLKVYRLSEELQCRGTPHPVLGCTDFPPPEALDKLPQVTADSLVVSLEVGNGFWALRDSSLHRFYLATVEASRGTVRPLAYKVYVWTGVPSLQHGLDFLVSP